MQENDFLSGMFNVEDSPIIETESTIVEEEFEAPQGHQTEEEVETTEAEPEGDEVIVKYIDFLKLNDLVEIPTDLESVKGTPEELQTIFDYTKKERESKAKESIMEALPEDFKPLFEYALAGGSSLSDFIKVYGEDPALSANIEDPTSQREVLKQYYQRTTKYSPEKIERLISYHSDPEDLRAAAEEAIEDLKSLKQEEQRTFIEQQARLEQEQREQAQQRIVELSNSIDNSGLIHPQRRNKVKSFFFDPIKVNDGTTTQFNHVIQTIFQNPAHQAQLGDILLEYDTEKGFVMERLERKVKTKAAQGFRELIEETLGSKPKPGQTKTAPTKGTSIDWEKYLEQ